MSRVEELPDDFDESKNSLTEKPVQDGVDMEDLFDRALEQGGLTSKTFEEVLSDISKTPLFMTNLDDAELGNNDLLQAIQALQYEGTKSEVAQNFKEQGNERVTVKQWIDAREFYDKGLAVLFDRNNERWEKPENEEEEQRKRHLLTEQLYSNRARCNLELKNFRSTTIDCAAAIRLNPHNIKAHYRSAVALFALDKVYEALDVCNRGLKLDQENLAMRTLMETIQKRSRVKETQHKRRKEEEERRRKEEAMLKTALAAREIQVRGATAPPDMTDVAIRLSPDPLSPKSTLEFPVMLLYPMHNQSDFVKAYSEKDALIDHLGYILPLPWDEKVQYKHDSVDCFMDTTSGGMMKVGKKLSLLKILSGGKTEVVDGLVRIHVIPQELAPTWIEEVKKKKGK